MRAKPLSQRGSVSDEKGEGASAHAQTLRETGKSQRHRFLIKGNSGQVM